MRRNEGYDAVIAELERVGIKPTVSKTKHIRLTWQWQGRDRLIVVSGSASDVRAAKNCRAVARRILRSDGLL